LAKRLSEKQKAEIIQKFISGTSLDNLSNQNNCSKLTITRNLKKHFGEKIFKELFLKSKLLHNEIKEKSSNTSNLTLNKDNKIIQKNNISEEAYINETHFTEIIPLDCEFENKPQKDLSSISISQITFPKIVYMIVDRKIELVIKYLRDYPDWQFLSQDELNRKTIEIYFDLKNAKRYCNKEQKVIKVPNTNVFKIVAPILISRGISRMISEDNLITL